MNPKLDSPLTSFLHSVNQHLQNLVANGNDPIHQMVQNLIQAGGKRIRPTLVFLTAAFSPDFQQPEVREKLVMTAASIELLHMASLVHDDVIDQADTRRGQSTINHKWGNHTAVLAGDHLFALAIHHLAAIENYSVLEITTKSISQMCAGEINQAGGAFRSDQTLVDYFKTIYQKTACLFTASCEAGALTVDLAPNTLNQIRQFGLYLGLAYQILDDLLDLIAEPEDIGKPIGNDLTQGILTLPVLYLLQDPQDGPWLKEILLRGRVTSAELQQVISRLIANGGFAHAYQYYQTLLAKAEQFLAVLPPSLLSQALPQYTKKLLAKPQQIVEKRLAATGSLVLYSQTPRDLTQIPSTEFEELSLSQLNISLLQAPC